MKINLPIDGALPQLGSLLKESSVVILEAPPGSGKTTRVAPFLCAQQTDQPGAAAAAAGVRGADRGTDRGAGRRVYLLQPRRVAARAAAERIAAEQGWTVGGEVGYQVRFESRCSAATRLVVATEGVLLRRLADDPILDEISTVLLDEFHERSLNADLLLGMLRRVQTLVRDDLRVVIMSATLDTDSLQTFLPAAPVLRVPGTMHPVEIRYQPPRPLQKLTEQVTAAVERAMAAGGGDILVFLPGVGEIQRVLDGLRLLPDARGWRILPLHGSLPLEEQAQVLRAQDGPRIVLATNVAETSLTLEGIRTVIDSGQVRVLRFDPRVGLDRLSLEPICQSSATQRAGRAGRLTAGVCLRLWDAASHRSRPLRLEAEVRRVDLSAAILQLLEWGERPADFPWLDAPRPEAQAAALSLLERLGATRHGALTPLGRTMARLPISPRLARMLIEAHRLGALDGATIAAALLSQRDPFLRHRNDSSQRPRTGPARGTGHDGLPPVTAAARWDCDIVQRVQLLESYRIGGRDVTPLGQLDRRTTHSIFEVSQQLARTVRQELGESPAVCGEPEQAIQRALLAAFPDRLARRRAAGEARGVMVGGRGVKLAPGSGVRQAEFFLCIDVDAAGSEALVRQASSVHLEWLSPEAITLREEQFFHPTRQQVVARHRRYFDDLLLAETPASVDDEPQCRHLLTEAARRDLAAVMPAGGSAFPAYLTRVECLRRWAPELELPTCDEGLLLSILSELVPGRRSFAELREAPWLDWLQARLTSAQQLAVERECPERIQVPSGNRIKIEYAVDKPPVLSVRIQELFSWKATPRIAMGRIPLLLHLLAPNMRPQQITDDLSSFWNSTYPVVRKELRRRYPKHAWPEDPWQAEPSRRR